MRGVAKALVVILTNCLLMNGADSHQASKEEPAPAKAEDLKEVLAPLGRFAGTWEKRFTIYKSEWSPADVARTGTHSCKWILKDRFLEETGKDSDGGTYQNIYAYDASTKEYRLFVFRSNGDILHMTGKWDGHSNTFTWSNKVPDGIVVTSSYQFTTPDEMKLIFLAKKGDKVYFRLEGTAKRVDDKK